jgi:hypothetical protein
MKPTNGQLGEYETTYGSIEEYFGCTFLDA